MASDYQLLYQNGRTLGIQEASESSFSTDAPNFSVFEYLKENQLKDRPLQINDRHCRLAVTHLESAQKEFGKRNVVSLWPLSADTKNIHYAWPEQGGLFQMDSTVIVDGIDCGRMSLEDALEGDMQVLTQADRFMMIPQSMEQELISKLQGAFLI